LRSNFPQKSKPKKPERRSKKTARQPGANSKTNKLFVCPSILANTTPTNFYNNKQGQTRPVMNMPLIFQKFRWRSISWMVKEEPSTQMRDSSCRSRALPTSDKAGRPRTRTTQRRKADKRTN